MFRADSTVLLDWLFKFIHHFFTGWWFQPSEKWWSSSVGINDSPTKRRKMFQTTNQCIYIYVYIYLYKYKYIIIPPLNPILTICNHINHSTSSWRPTSPAQRLWPHWRLPVAPSWDFRRFPRRPWAEATGISDGAEFGIPKLMIEWWMGKLVYKAGKVSWASFWGIHRMGWMGYIT